MTLQIWICSFIPKDIAGYTRTIPAGGGKTMIPGPLPVSDCFHTDQRAFSSQPTVSSRTRSKIEIDTATMTLAAQNHHCDPTVECDCEDGDEECNKVPDSSGLKITGFQSSGTACSFTFEGGAGNPCAGRLAPDIDWLVKVEVKKQGASVSVKLGAGSLVEPFPAFECYASLNGVTKTLFQRPPDTGTTPWNLPGPPNKPVSGSVAFP